MTVEYRLTIDSAEPLRLRHVILFGITIFTTLIAGTTFLPRFFDQGLFAYFRELVEKPYLIFLGLPFALPLLLILGVHEMGHFLTARRHGVRVTWPYFLPGPPFLSLGTFGAFIRLKSPLLSRGSLIDVGATGPLWGFGASVLVALLGFALGLTGIRMPTDLGFNVHLPLAYWWMQGVFTGRWSFTLTFFDNPVLLAAWVGFFVQGLNLMPLGQLDGGHVLYALTGKLHKKISFSVGILFLVFAFFHPQWLLWALLVFFVIGLDHPPCMDDSRHLSSRQKALALFSIFIFVVTFLPLPFA